MERVVNKEELQIPEVCHWRDQQNSSTHNDNAFKRLGVTGDDLSHHHLHSHADD